ncbi:MAG: OmpA family protein [Bacteroidota bacterium]
MSRKTHNGKYLFRPINTWGFHRFLLFSFISLISFQTLGQSSDAKSNKIFQKAKEAFNSRDYESAEKHLSKLLAGNANYIDAYLLRFEIGMETRNNAKAIESLQKAVDIDASYFPNAHYFLGQFAMLSGEYERAMDYYGDFLRFQPDSNHPLWSQAKEGQDRATFAMNLKKMAVPFDPKNMGKAINSSFDEYYPSLTADDKGLLYTRKLDHPERRRLQEDFYFSRKNENWENAEAIRNLNTPFNEGAPTISKDGNLMIYTTCAINQDLEYTGRKKGYGSCDLFYSQKVNGQWTPGVNMGKAINSWHWESQPSLSANGRVLYFIRGNISRDYPGPRNKDIFYSELTEDGQWTKAMKLSQDINTTGDESSVMIHPDGETLYFSSDGHFGMGGEDIFVAHLKKGEWSKPINLGYPINTHKNENSLTVLASGDVALYASNREGGFGGLDLYEFQLPEFAKSRPVTYFKGVVIDEKTKGKIGAQVQIYELESGELVAEAYSDPQTGEFLVSLPTEKSYALNASALGYLFYSENFDYTKGNEEKAIEKIVPMKKIEKGVSIVLENIFFDTDKSNLKESSFVELNKLKQVLNYYPELKIQIQGHTDNVGDDIYNLGLSKERANSVMVWLYEQGIEKGRVSAEGFGESRPIASNETEEGRAQNRRTEVMIIE